MYRAKFLDFARGSELEFAAVQDVRLFLAV